jgi:hypothetical protein
MATAPVEQTYWGNAFWAILIMPFVSLNFHLFILAGLVAERGCWFVCRVTPFHFPSSIRLENLIDTCNRAWA